MSDVEYEIKDKIGYITFNRPDKLNAIDAEMRDELWRVMHDVNDNPEVWLAVITGRGRAFSVGADLASIAVRSDDPYVDDNPTEDLYVYQTQIYKPIIASINGFCLAQGGGIALASDIRIASDRAYFSWPQARRGIGSVSGPCILAHRLPLNFAFEFMLIGNMIPADRALELGLVNKVVPHDELESATQVFVETLRGNAPLAMRAIKEVTLRDLNMRLEDRVRLAGFVNRRIQRTQDAQEGIQAFTERRMPMFQGR